MSSGGVWQIQIRDIRNDRYLHRHEELVAELEKITKLRQTKHGTVKRALAKAKAAGDGDAVAKLAKTEKVWRNAAPTQQDIAKTHINYVSRTYKPHVMVASEYIKVNAEGSTGRIGAAGGSATFKLPPNAGSFTSDIAFRVVIDPVRAADVATSAAGAGFNAAVRYCAYPGLRLLEKVEFTSDGQPIDDYTSLDAAFVNKFEVGKDRRAAFDRAVGQGALEELNFNHVARATGVQYVRRGPQTVRTTQPKLEMFIPAMFDFCKSPDAALFNDDGNDTQREITLTLAPLADILFAYDESTTNPGLGPVAPPDSPLAPLPLLASASVNVKIEMYVNNLYIPTEVRDVFSSRMGFSLIRVHKRQTKSVDQVNERGILLDKFKFPTEHMYVAFRRKANLNDPDHWHLMGYDDAPTDPLEQIIALCGRNDAGLTVRRPVRRVSSLAPLVTGVSMEEHGNILIPTLAPTFFSSHLPGRYANTHRGAVYAPDDRAAMLIPFAMHPGQDQPSGHLNLSTARELYLKYQSDSIDSANPAQLVICAQALNFLRRQGDKLALEYAV